MQHSFSVAGLFVALACSGLHAQTMDLRATVPFPFHAGAVMMPAGDYTIHHWNGVLRIQEAGASHAAALLLTNTVTRSNRAAGARVEFHRYGETYFLSSVWIPEFRTAVSCQKAERRRSLQAALGGPKR